MTLGDFAKNVIDAASSCEIKFEVLGIGDLVVPVRMKWIAPVPGIFEKAELLFETNGEPYWEHVEQEV